MPKADIIYTLTDEAPMLATYSLLPIIKSFVSAVGVTVGVKDISLAARILAQFPEYLTEEQQQENHLKELGEMVLDSSANIIKLPNISASIPQLTAAIAELNEQGYKVPPYPAIPNTAYENDIKKRYAKVLGSAVNPVLRVGNSDRRAVSAVKHYAKSNPHRMGKWSSDSKTHVASMTEGDFFASEQSVVMSADDNVSIILEHAEGSKVLRENLSLLQGEVIDASFMSVKALREFYEVEIQDAFNQEVLLSLHLKATMMKVSDPVIFGHAVKTYYKEVFDKYAEEFEEINVNVNNGIGDVYAKIVKLPEELQEQIKADIDACYVNGPSLAMVDSDKGITNLHVPSDVIIDASMPAAIRDGGKMWNSRGERADTKALIPDRCYAGVYDEAIKFCKEHGALDPSKLGTVHNIGLMAMKAEEYGSHDKTFKIRHDGRVKVVNSAGETLMEHAVEQGDIWRMCQTKDRAIRAWIRLAVKRASRTGYPAVFWLDANRPHDANLIEKVNAELANIDSGDITLSIMSPQAATRLSFEMIAAGKNIISVTGNVLRDYLTDLFPILELGTSAKMLSVVPLLEGGGLYETGAGGSAPKHVKQVKKENHLRWDSLGEFLALGASLTDLANKKEDVRIQVMADALDEANRAYLENNKAPGRKVGEIDNRGTHFYLCLYWAQALANQQSDQALADKFAPIAEALMDSKPYIIDRLNTIQGKPIDLGGYYKPNEAKLKDIMRPVKTFNRILKQI